MVAPGLHPFAQSVFTEFQLPQLSLNQMSALWQMYDAWGLVTVHVVVVATQLAS